MFINSTSISASAGTGKTYQLSRRFLALLALNHGKNPEQLIAITFTKKAAGEFLDRILSDIAKGASCEEEASKLADEIWETIKGDGTNPETNPEANIGIYPDLPDHKKDELLNIDTFKKMLRVLVENLTRLNLCTIDSLFSSIVKSCTFELGINDFQILSGKAEKNQALNEVLLSIYKDCLADKELQQSFEEIFLTAVQNNADAVSLKDSSIVKNIDSLLEAYISAPEEEKWGLPEEILKTYKTPEIANINEFRREIASALSHLNSFEFKSRSKDSEEKARAKAHKNLIGILEALNNYIDFQSLGSLKIEMPIDEIKNTLRDVCWTDSIDKILQTWICYDLALLQKRTKATYKLVKILADKYTEKINKNGKFEFRDVPLILKSKELSPEFRDELQYRMFCKYRHWMLDEFQDTSRIQWDIIKPFIDDLQESDGENSSTFIVGDLKQSIYQWRGGDPRLFLNAPKQLELHNRTMSESYRSSQYVLNLVNEVCDYKNSPVSQLISPQAMGMWGDFPKHKTCNKNKKKKGIAQIWQAVDSNAQTIATIIAHIYQKDASIKNKSVAILVDKTKHGLQLREALKEKGIPAEVCDDVAIGVDSSLGKILKQFFHWLDMPGDKHIETLLRYSRLNSCIFEKGWSSWRQILETSGYRAVLETLKKEFETHKITLNEYCQNRFNVWLASAIEADSKGLEIQAWLECMETLEIRETPPKDIIQIMTIHKSKGLGFDVVFVPSMGKNTAFDNEGHLHYILTKDDDGNVTSVIQNPSNKLILQLVPDLGKLKEPWRAEQHFDGLCKIYVALTRAKEACYAIMPKLSDETEKGKAEKNLSMRSTLLCHENEEAASIPSIDDPSPKEDNKAPAPLGKCIYSSHSPDYYSEATDTPNIEIKTIAEPINWPTVLPLIRKQISPSKLHTTEGQIQKSASNSEEMRTAAQFGTEVHSVFERIGRWDEGNKPAWLIEPTTDAERAVAECFENPEICELFTVSESAQIMREQNIESVDAEKWISGTIDRLVIDGNRATIIDFKTDRCSIEEMKNRHTAQLHAYAEIVNQITGIPLDNIECKLVSTKHKCIISI